MKKWQGLLSAIVFSAMIFSACASGTVSESDAQPKPVPQEELVLLPTSGYVCGTEGTQTLLQSFFIAQSMDVAAVQSLYMECVDGTVINCSDFRADSLDRDVLGNNLYHYGLHMQFPAAGRYVVKKLVLYFLQKEDGPNGELRYSGTGIPVERMLDGEVIIESAKAEEAIHVDGPIEMIEFQINQVDHTLYRLTLNNKTDKTAVIKSISFPTQLYERIESVMSYEDLGLQVPREGLELPPMSECAFAFRLLPKDADAFAKIENSVYLFLPYLTYEIDGQPVTIISQYQATVFEPNITPAYLEQLISESA